MTAAKGQIIDRYGYRAQKDPSKRFREERATRFCDPWKSQLLTFAQHRLGVEVFDVRHNLSALFVPSDIGYDRALRELNSRG